MYDPADIPTAAIEADADLYRQADIDHALCRDDDESTCPHGETGPCGECRDEGVADYEGEDRADMDFGDEVPQ